MFAELMGELIDPAVELAHLLEPDGLAEKIGLHDPVFGEIRQDHPGGPVLRPLLEYLPECRADDPDDITGDGGCTGKSALHPLVTEILCLEVDDRASGRKAVSSRLDACILDVLGYLMLAKEKELNVGGILWGCLRI